MSSHLSRRGQSPAGSPAATCGLPGPRRAGSSVLLGLAPGGVCLAAASPRRRCALTAPFHLRLYAAHVWPRHRLCISVALSRGFPRVGVTHRPRSVVSGLSSRGCLSPRGCSARSWMVDPQRPAHAARKVLVIGAIERWKEPGASSGRERIRPCERRRLPARGRVPRCCGSAPSPRSLAAGGRGQTRGRSA